jgi:heavy metal sensor kinase
MKALGIRGRLTLWYGGALAAALLLFSLLMYYFMGHQRWMDEQLVAELKELTALVAGAPTREAVIAGCEAKFRGREGFRYQVRVRNGVTLFRSDRLHRSDLPVDLAPGGGLQIEDHQIAAVGHYRVATVPVGNAGGNYVVQAAMSLFWYDLRMWQMRIALALAAPASLAIALVGGYLLARKALAPVDEMAAAASRITAHDLNRRIEVPGSADELTRLGETLNHMIARLGRSFDEVRRFTADAAHELRTPLAIMRSEAEIALRTPRDPDEYRRVLESILEETSHLTQLAERLLYLCREDSGISSAPLEPVALDELLDDLCEQMQLAASERNIVIHSAIDRDCVVRGDVPRLRRLFRNLLDNATKYTAPGGSVRLTTRVLERQVEIAVQDNGCGIPPESLPFIFDRFYRVDASRNPEVKGTGLGLAICRSVVEAHGGTIDVESRYGVGTTFRVRLQRIDTKQAVQSGPPREAAGSR